MNNQLQLHIKILSEDCNAETYIRLPLKIVQTYLAAEGYCADLLQIDGFTRIRNLKRVFYS